MVSQISARELALSFRQEVVVTTALHRLRAPRIKSLRPAAFRIDLTAIFHWLENKWRRRPSARELDGTSDHYLRDMGIENSEMYDVSELSLKCLRVGPRGP
jgi:uncharacterized protein YjiS (DUF1127 family)